MTAPRDPLLRRIDDTWVPSLAGRLQRFVARSTAAFHQATGPTSPAGAAAREEPALAGSIAAVLIAALLVGVFGPHEPHDHDAGPAAPVGAVAPPQQTLGPRAGTPVSDYLRDAAFSLRHFGETSHGRPTYALISLRAYDTPAQIVATFRGVEVSRAYVRVPSPTLLTSVYPVALSNTFDDLITGMESQSRFAGLNAKTYGQIVAGFSAKTAREKEEKKLYQELATAAAYESAALGRPQECACVFSVLVHAGFAQLAALARDPGVRAVDPAAPGLTPADLSVVPLRPDVTTTVPKPGVLGVG